MAGRKTSDEWRAKMQAAGLWKFFVDYRDQLKAEGYAPKDAHIMATEEAENRFAVLAVNGMAVVPNVVEPVETVEQEPLDIPVEIPVKDETIEQSASKLKKALEKRSDTRDVSFPARPAPRSPLVILPPTEAASVSDFEGKTASEQEVIRWVASNMEMVDPKKADCPDPIAWNLLMHCKSSPMAKASFWQSTYPKLIPSKSQLEGGGRPIEFDGKDLVEFIDRIKQAAKEAVQNV